MNHHELLERILTLVPEAKCSVWQCKKEEYMGEVEPIQIGDYLVCWNTSNHFPCPSHEDLMRLRKSDIGLRSEEIKEN